MLKGIEDIEGLTPEQVEAINEKAEGLLSKNSELIDKLNKTKSASTESMSELEKLKAFKEQAEMQAAEDAKNWEETKRILTERHEKELSALQESYQQSQGTIEKLLIDDGLSKALDSIHVNPTLKAGAEAMLRSSVKIVDGKAVVGDQALSDYVSEWAESDTGKAFRLALKNSGGDASGGGDTKPNTSGDVVRDNLAKRLKQRKIA